MPLIMTLPTHDALRFLATTALENAQGHHDFCKLPSSSTNDCPDIIIDNNNNNNTHSRRRLCDVQRAIMQNDVSDPHLRPVTRSCVKASSHCVDSQPIISRETTYEPISSTSSTSSTSSSSSSSTSHSSSSPPRQTKSPSKRKGRKESSPQLKRRVVLDNRRKKLKARALAIKSLDNSPVNDRQLVVLRMVYEQITMYPCEPWMVLLAIIIHRAFKQVKNWFSNERQKRGGTDKDQVISVQTRTGEKLRLRPEAVDAQPEWSDEFFEEVLMIFNFRVQCTSRWQAGRAYHDTTSAPNAHS